MRFAIPLLVLLVLSPLAPAENAENLRTISTTGEAVVYVVPDEVVIGFGIETFDTNLDKAKSANDSASVKLLKAVRDLKVEEKHIQTDVLTVELRYQSSTHLLIEGYVCRRSYSVTLKDPKMFEKLIDVVLKNGANQINGFEFRSTELRKHRDQARKMAIKAAKEKAADLSKELECGVGKPRTIGEGYSYFGSYNRSSMGNNAQQVAQGGGEVAAEGEQTMPLGQIGIRASVSVTFDLDVK